MLWSSAAFAMAVPSSYSSNMATYIHAHPARAQRSDYWAREQFPETNESSSSADSHLLVPKTILDNPLSLYPSHRSAVPQLVPQLVSGFPSVLPSALQLVMQLVLQWGNQKKAEVALRSIVAECTKPQKQKAKQHPHNRPKSAKIG